MKRIFFRAMAIFTLFCTAQASTTENGMFNPKNYIFDDEGNPLFVKVYIKTSKADTSCEGEKVISLSSQKNDLQILKLLMQEDRNGDFIAIPIKKKKKSHDEDDDDDESNWECPYCHTLNPSSRNACSNPDCVLYRKGWRDW